MELYTYKNQKKLRCGFTTGTCAAAGAAGAVSLLLLGKELSEVTVMTPKGIAVTIPVVVKEARETYVVCSVIKDSGDDPDITDGMEILVKAEYGKRMPEETDGRISLLAGKGIGTITKPGLEQQVGEPAINKVPRKMIREIVQRVCEQAGYTGALQVEIGAPKGEELAKRTFNPKLGIEGGISILGTSGIVEPMSESALIATIEAELKMRKAEGISHILIAPGNYGEQYIRKELGIQNPKTIKCSNYIGETIDMAVGMGFQSLLLVGNFGKLVKLAAGIMNTHSRIADGRMETIGVYTALSGGRKETVAAVMSSTTTEHALDILEEKHLYRQVLDSILLKIHERINERVCGQIKAGVIVFSEKRRILGKTPYAEELLRYQKKEGEE